MSAGLLSADDVLRDKTSTAGRADFGLQTPRRVESGASVKPKLYHSKKSNDLSVVPTPATANASTPPPELRPGFDLAAKWRVASDRPPRALDAFKTMQQWEGVVTAIVADQIIARVVDQTHSGLREEVEFSIHELDEADLELVVPGAVFYWAIGYLDQPRRPRRTVSDIRFRRSLPPDKRDTEAAREYARRILATLGDDE